MWPYTEEENKKSAIKLFKEKDKDKKTNKTKKTKY